MMQAGGLTSHSAEVGEQPANRLELRALSKHFGSVRAVESVSIGLQPGQMLALLGPSGCGKTTTLRMVAGLEKPTGGEIVLDGAVLATATSSVPPERRGLGMVFQNYALWPHMTVFENVAYGLRRQKLPNAEVQSRVGEVLRIAGMSGYEQRPVTALSGGQQQRVAVARALATKPRILLFDEPLSNLDALLRESMRFEVRSLQQNNGITAIYVTHSQEEALAIADIVAVMNDGRIQQAGRPEELYRRPRNRFVAGFVGLANVLKGSVRETKQGRVTVALENATLCDCEPAVAGLVAGLRTGTEVSLAVRPENIRLTKGGESRVAGHATSFVGTVASVVFTGNLIDYFVRADGIDTPLRVQSMPPSLVNAGDTVVLSVDWPNCILLDD